MKQINKILLIGSFSENSSIYTYATSFRNVLAELGFIVKTFDYRTQYLPTHHTNFLNKKLINYKLKKVAKNFDPDLILIIKGENLFASTIKYLKETTNSLIVNFYTDNPFVFWNGNSNKEILNALPYYDRMLIWSKSLIPVLISAGAKSACYFPFCFDEEIFQKDCNKSQYVYDVTFIGSWDKEREIWIKNLIEIMKDLNLAIWGNGWEKRFKSFENKKVFKGRAIYEKNMIEVFQKSKIVLNFIRKQNLDSHNMRTMEVLASKGFLLTQRTAEQSEVLFLENQHLACFSSIKELVEKINFYIKEDKIRETIILNGSAEVKKYSLQKMLPILIDALKTNSCLKECNEPRFKFFDCSTKTQDRNNIDLSV